MKQTVNNGNICTDDLTTEACEVQRLPGVEYSKEEQLQRLEALRKQLSLKKKLLLKYKSKAQPEQSH
ncbi:Mediator of RNA polymerase II transcription subunit 9 [Armadillidium vulgare]|nr:Mediator of RNA polymerase II transcription subunit 9 [Armadillidium vulgare]